MDMKEQAAGQAVTRVLLAKVIEQGYDAVPGADLELEIARDRDSCRFVLRGPWTDLSDVAEEVESLILNLNPREVS